MDRFSAEDEQIPIIGSAHPPKSQTHNPNKNCCLAHEYFWIDYLLFLRCDDGPHGEGHMGVFISGKLGVGDNSELFLGRLVLDDFCHKNTENNLENLEN